MNVRRARRAGRSARRRQYRPGAATSRAIESTAAPHAAMTKLLAGPAAAISAKSRFGCLSIRGSTGTGFAQPISGTLVSIGDQRKQQRADRIDMDGRIERQAAKLPRRRIAEPIRRPGMRRLVHRQRRDQHDENDENFGEIDVLHGPNQKGITRSYLLSREATRRIVASNRSTSAGLRPEIDDARAQREAAADDGVRQVGIAVALDLDHQRLVEGIVSAAVAKADDAERRRRQQFEVVRSRRWRPPGVAPPRCCRRSRLESRARRGSSAGTRSSGRGTAATARGCDPNTRTPTCRDRRPRRYSRRLPRTRAATPPHSRTSRQPTSSGAYSHLCGSSESESARWSADIAPLTCSDCAARAPYEPSTCSHSRASSQTSAMASSGSIAPVLTSPAVATTHTGWKPAARSDCDLPPQRVWRPCAASASTGMRTIASLPMPSIDAALASTCASSRTCRCAACPAVPPRRADSDRRRCWREARRPGRRSSRTSRRSAARRSPSGSKPTIVFSQSITWCSMVVAAGADRHEVTFWLIAEASRSRDRAGEAAGRLHVAEHPRMAVVAAVAGDLVEVGHHVGDVLRIGRQRAGEAGRQLARADRRIDGQRRLAP